jgi:predicted lipoprotein with Yx(FWY)xxD motif
MKKNQLIILITVLLISIAGFAYYKHKPEHLVTSSKVSEKFGTYLTDTSSMTLYFNPTDPAKETACDYNCLKFFKPFFVDLSSTGNDDFIKKNYNFGSKITVVKRSDGLYQYAYDGKLLYKFFGDTNAGDIKGLNLFNQKWDLIKL